MTLFVGGRLSATPIKIKVKAALDEIRDAMASSPYSGLPGTGWGGLNDPTDDVGRPGAQRPITGKPRIFEADPERGYPERLMGRFYFDELDKRAMNRFADADESALHIFRACDYSISDLPSEPDHYLVFLGMGHSTSGFGSHVIPSLRAVLEELDKTAAIFLDSSPRDFGDNDFFKWLLYRSINNPLVGDMKLDYIRHIDGQDGHSRGTTISGGADIDRPELLALVAANYTEFGPVKVRLNHSALDVLVDIEIRFDGGYAIKTADSVYGDETTMSKAEKSLRLIQDVGFRILPELTSEWLGDSSWPSINRPQFISDARASLIHALAPARPGHPCEACGKTV